MRDDTHFEAAAATIVVALAMFSSSCGNVERSHTVATFDTLPNGVIVVMNSTSGSARSKVRWSLEEELRIGSDLSDRPDQFAGIIDVEVDRAGHIYVLDGGSQSIKVFDTDGKFIRSIGTRGHGPAEFAQAAGLAWDHEGRLLVADPGNARFSLFDTAGNHLRDYPRQASGVILPWEGGVDSAGRIYDYDLNAGKLEMLILSLNEPTGAAGVHVTATVPIPSSPSPEILLKAPNGRLVASMPVPFSPRTVHYADPNEFLWFGSNETYRIIKRRWDGDTLLIVTMPFEKAEVSAEEVAASMKSVATFVKNGGKVEGPPPPRYKPVFAWLTTDDQGYLWVFPYVKDADEGNPLDVFDPQGEYRGRVVATFAIESTRSPLIRGNTFVSIVRDSTGVEHVVRARINRLAR